jgi:D-alanyl-D-alanine carboxypeptidase (penicillin-binding protein 5/6)
LIARAIKDNKDILLVMLNAKTDRWNIAVDMFDSAFSSNRPNPDWFAQTSRVDAGRIRIPVAVSPVKADKKESHVSRSGHMSKKQVIARLKSSRKSKHQAIAELKTKRKSDKHAVVSLKSTHKLKKREFVSSKSVRKNKKKATLS